MNVVDYIIVAFVALGALKGYRKGLLKGLVCLLSWFAALAGAYFLCPSAVTWLNRRLGLTLALTEILRQKIPVTALAQNGTQGPAASGLDFSGLGRYLQDIWAATPGNAGGVADVLSRQMASIFAHGLVFAALAVGVYIVLHLLSRILSWFLGGTILGFFNRLGGMVFGAGVNVVVAALAIGLLTPWLLMGTWEPGSMWHSLVDYLSESVVAPYFSFLFIKVSAALAGMSL